MERCRDYLYFATWFAGIGYAVLWPLAALGHGGRLFGASVLCGGSPRGLTAALCGLPHPLVLPLGLHLVGSAAAATVGARLSWRLLRRMRARFSAAPIATQSTSVVLPPDPPHVSLRRLRAVKPRTQFGLRGVPPETVSRLHESRERV